jgi:hypothetical protein
MKAASLTSEIFSFQSSLLLFSEIFLAAVIPMFSKNKPLIGSASNQYKQLHFNVFLDYNMQGYQNTEGTVYEDVHIVYLFLHSLLIFIKLDYLLMF